MVFCERNVKKYFDDQLIDYLKEGKYQAVVHLIQNIPADKLVDCRGTTLLHLAAKYNSANIVYYLINQGSVIDAVDDWSTTPLIMAVKEESVAAVKLLLEKSANIYPTELYETCALNVTMKLSALSSKSLSIIKEFFKVISFDLANGRLSINELASKLQQAECPLYRAVYLYNPEVTRTMISFKPGCVNSQDSDTGNTALHEAAYQSDIPNMLVLLQNGADISIKNKKGKEPEVLKFCYNMEILSLLLKRNIAWEESENDSKAMKLRHVLSKCSKAAVQLFLQYCNINFLRRDNLEKTALYYLIENNNKDVLDLFKYTDINVNALDRSNHSALHYAALYGDPISTQFLLEKGADPNIRCNSNYTPLLYVIQQTSSDSSLRKKCVELLLLFGADPEFQRDGDTVIGLTEQLDLSHLIEPLLAHFALLDSEDKPISDRSSISRAQITLSHLTIDYYNQCLADLEHLKQEKLYRSLTMYTFLVSDEYTLASYIHIPSISHRFSQEQIHYNSFYNEILKRHFNKAVEILNLRKSAMRRLSDMFRIWASDDHVLELIVGFFKYEDLVILHEN
ncbi:putative ankyrin repeat protein RF_0381 [Phymastichus coffea]|uniref:putative ankyrin repeat protein RF_0381 n=1 Tax=Phymastichus coffea TaxID=108790 RepID=UPI00273C2FD5|nr:putative ankyrin repeat protein RF_0381 [Phymastichus coffea]XP_058809609.1 putative ankyrin repeat protein RF_0381 [Phymastichus coffea]